MKHSGILAAATAIFLGACSSDADRYAVPAVKPTERINILYGSVEIRDVTLPTYAAADEIHQQSDTGILKSSTSILWADEPERAIALELTRHLSQLTGSRIASDPWPFESFPDARLEVRFEDLLADATGQLHASGQYFVAVEAGRERSGFFDLTAPFDPAQGPAAIASARAQIILDLAEYIAANGLR